MSAVELRDVFRIHSTPEGDAAALQGLTLTVADGELLAVLGPSGSGKTSLLRILAGDDLPSAGTARALGHELASLRGRARAAYRARELGLLPQRPDDALAPELTVRELVRLRLDLLGADGDPDGLLERAGLAGRAHARPGELSGGERQRVALCAALVHRPRLLLADEPTGELDAASGAAVMELVRELVHESGATAVVVTHDPAAAAVADRIVRIRDGRVAKEAGAGGEQLVVARGGWVRVPEELLRRAGIGDRAAAEAAADGVLLRPAGTAAAAAPAEEWARVLRATHGSVDASLRGVRRGYPGRPAVLDGLDAGFAGGALTVVTGPSGSGKSTLLRLLAGLDLPEAGEVLVGGTSLAALDREGRAALRRERIGYVDQGPRLPGFLTATEAVELTLALRGRAEPEAAVEALASVGLAERAAQRVARLSAGEQVRVAIARALAARPALLVADEPTARLDRAGSLAVASLLARLARETGAAVVCASHDPVVAEQADAELRLGSG